MEFDNNRIAYLQMIESIIDRMSNKSGRNVIKARRAKGRKKLSA